MKRELRCQLNRTKKSLLPSGNLHKSFIQMYKLLEMVLSEIDEFSKEKVKMDKKIKKIIKDTKKVEKEEKSLLKEDIKRDKLVEKGKKASKKKK